MLVNITLKNLLFSATNTESRALQCTLTAMLCFDGLHITNIEELLAQPLLSESVYMYVATYRRDWLISAPCFFPSFN